MVVLNRIYTRTGDAGTTALVTASGGRNTTSGSPATAPSTRPTPRWVSPDLHTAGIEPLDAMLLRIQNDLFDLGADLATPESDEPPAWEPLRIVASQVTRLEGEIDTLNADLEPLRSFVLPGGSAAAANLHLARTVCRRAERLAVELAADAGERVNPEVVKYLNRLSDFLFVAARWGQRQGPRRRALGAGQEPVGRAEPGLGRLRSTPGTLPGAARRPSRKGRVMVVRFRRPR